jgi:ubiquitin carboxyl-terminal hydrolase 5/13
VYREDCTLCFDGIDDEAGIDVCLHCFNGGCAGERRHSHEHASQHKHPLAVNVSRTRKRKPQRDDSEPAAKISKLEIVAETDADRWDTVTNVKCFECDVQGIEGEGVSNVVQSVLKANTFAQQEDVKAWELELEACEHALCLQQEEGREIAGGELGQCSGCELKENLWLCLTCGALGCGRQQMGGAPGNSHARLHGEATGHPIAVKLGSITAEGNADIYCYTCKDERIDPELVAHLANWGIDLAGRVKTEKSMGEMQLEHNLNYDFSMMGDDGKEMTPLFGPGLTGLMNLGNSCYLASILQSLFAMPEFQSRYYRPGEPLPQLDDPAADIEAQLRKLADGLLSGRYSKSDTNINLSDNPDEKSHQKGLAPAMLKHLIGRGHAEFGTSRQQDAFELLLHLLKLISRSQQGARAQFANITDPVDSFRFHMEQKLQCLQCKKVRYRQDEMENISVAVPIKRLPTEDFPMVDGEEKKGSEFEPVTLKQCLDDFTAPEVVELTCSGCGNKGFTKQSLFKSFPTILAVNARRFEIVNWVPTKQDVPVIVGDGVFDMEAYRSPGKQPGEEELPEDNKDAAPGAFAPNETALEALMSMGFPRPRCEKALHATGNTADAEVAMGWLFEHMEDPDIDEPLVLPGASATGAAAAGPVDPEKIENLGNMGFSAPQARQALKETGSDMERAVDWLFSHPDAVGDFGEDDAGAATEQAAAPVVTGEIEDTKPAQFTLKSIVCHKGSSIHAGHYVAFVKKEEGWVLFNDEKVALAGGDVEAMKSFAYVYFFRREGVTA